jgi:5'-nucleotidase
MRVQRVALILSAAALMAACSSSGSSQGSGSTTTAGGATTSAATGGGSTSTTPTGGATTTTATSAHQSTSTSTGSTAASTTTIDTTTKLTVLVTNDDGIGAAGIDAVVSALQKTPNLTVVVVAPATNQSGSSDKATSGGAKGNKATTKSGVEGTAVVGFPADAVNYALDTLALKPDLVVSGANSGVNFGPLVAVSGTVGAARTAARRGVPAIAVSAGVDDPVSAAAGAQFVVAEINAHRSSYGFGKNTSTAVKLAEIGKFNNFDCASTAENPVDDITAVDIGFASRSVVPANV